MFGDPWDEDGDAENDDTEPEAMLDAHMNLDEALHNLAATYST